MDSRLATQCIALGAAGALIAQTLGTTAQPVAASPSFAVAGAAAIAAVLSNKPRWLEATGIAGLSILVLVQFVAADPLITTVGVGLVLGGAAGLAKTPLHQAVLAGGVAAGIIADGVLWDIPKRYAEYLSAPSPDYWRLALIAVTAISLLWASWSSTSPASAQVMAVGIGLPLVTAAAVQLDDRLLISLGIAAAVVLAAFLLPGRSGLAVLAGGALATGWTGLGFTTPIPAAVLIGLIAAGLAIGLRQPYSYVGIAIVAASLIPLYLDGVTGLAPYLAAAGAAYALGSSIPAPAPVVALAVASPFYLASAASRGWVAYTPLTDGNHWIPALIVAAYAVAAVILARRR